jgi:hypothetical protein
LAWIGWWDDIARMIPYLWVHMNTGFYLVFSTGLLAIWLMMFFVFDRLTYWRIRPGQMTEERLIGGGAESFDTNGLRFQKLGADFFRVALGRFWRRRSQSGHNERGRDNDRNPQRPLHRGQGARHREVDLCKAGTHLIMPSGAIHHPSEVQESRCKPRSPVSKLKLSRT